MYNQFWFAVRYHEWHIYDLDVFPGGKISKLIVVDYRLTRPSFQLTHVTHLLSRCLYQAPFDRWWDLKFDSRIKRGTVTVPVTNEKWRISIEGRNKSWNLPEGKQQGNWSQVNGGQWGYGRYYPMFSSPSLRPPFSSAPLLFAKGADRFRSSIARTRIEELPATLAYLGMVGWLTDWGFRPHWLVLN